MFILSDNRKLTFEEKVARVEEVLKSIQMQHDQP